ncbi:MAG TPA: sulfite exporter TauE/SafE family protein, partial [Solirubrobacteraceae bacterium]|nr:sulfite exporter TauE/SafE family protein [Solirubrobacteraceae bacterium]
MVVEAILFGLVIGVVIGMLGGGGAILTVPVLVYVLGENVHAATTSSLFVVSLAAGMGAWGQAREECVCWKHTTAFVPTALAGAVAGTAVNRLVGPTLLLLLFAGLMLAASLATWNKGAAAKEGVIGFRCPPVQRTRVVVAGIGVGFLTGFLGVGGGFVIVPVLAV